MVELKGDERVDYLLNDQRRQIIQSPTVFAFSVDAVLLAHFTYLPIKRGRVLDLCTGNGVIPLFLTKRSQAKIVGVEIQERLYDMAVRNVQLNKLTDQIDMIQGDLREETKRFNQTFDVVTCNPPYFKTKEPNKRNQNEHLTIARHEVYCDLNDVLKACSRSVKSGGKVSMVHRPNRLSEIMTVAKSYKLEVKRLKFVYPKRHKEANIVLVEFAKDGQPDLKVEPPLYIHEENGDYTKEMTKILYGEEGSSAHG
ncbi:tRNA1(Val) (adenine(37)-N6)-methyltransferase [Alkalibacillus haloalkaliphilus]|uniref:tRNA1(Val) (adenine(37)-N6)-methyltransferase n=1 Tax=Alkalibacillus haloalkaliphilus TaxID=94136 RepID=UPI0002EC7902|nr:tRNA1(Val) (adenine(37)-N6)-methyltransferase [Alkalibacillus haloalkaliphilus]